MADHQEHDEKEYDLDHEDALRRLRARVRNLSDDVSEHKRKIAEHQVHIERTVKDVANLQQTSVNHIQFEGAIALLKQTLENLTSTVQEIKSGINWGVKLILGAVILGWIALLFKN